MEVHILQLRNLFKVFLDDFAFYRCRWNGTLLTFLRTFINHIQSVDQNTLEMAMDNDCNFDAPGGEDGIREHCTQLQSLLNLAVAIHTANNNGQNTEYIVDGFNTIKNILTQRNLWLI